MNDYVLGKYTNKNTFIHKMDARVKIVLLIIMMVGIFLDFGSYVSTFMVQGFILLFVLILCLICRIKLLSVLSSLKILWFTVIFLFVINVFIPNNNYVYPLYTFENGYAFYLDGIFQSIKIIFRIMITIIITLVLTSSTKPTDLSRAFEFYFYPLKFIGFPSAELAMVMSLALRFIPTILEEALRLKKAQESRGVDFEKGSIIRKIKALFSLVIPLFISAFSRSQELADALEVRGYIPNAKRTHYSSLTFTYRDIIGFCFTGLVFSLVFVAAYFKFDLVQVMFNFSNAITVLGIK